MKKVCLGSMLLVVASATAAHATEEPLTPRYMRAVGVQLNGASWLFTSFTCGEGKNALVYRREESQRGLIVHRTIGDSPAEKSGIHCGDMIVAVNNHVVPDYTTLRSIMDSEPVGTPVRLTIARPVPVSVNSNGVVFVRYAERRELDLNTIEYDRIAALQRQPSRDEVLDINDEFGKKFLLRATSMFSERPNGMIEYSCSFSHEGEQDMVLLESAYFVAFGSKELLPRVRKGETKTFIFSASIEHDGIPVRTSIRTTVDRHLYIKKAQDYMKKFGGAISRNDEGDKSGDWHTWVPFTAECWVPESLARAIAIKRERGA